MRLKLLLGFLVILLITTIINGWFFYGEKPKEALIVVLISIISAFIISFYLSWIYTKEIKKLAAYAENVSRGDLRVKLDVKGSDEVKKLCDSIKSMIEFIAMLIKETGTISKTINNASQALSAFSEEMNASTQEISSTVQAIASGAENQARSSERVFEITKRNTLFMEQMSDKSRDIYEKIQESLESAKLGVDNISQAIADMESIFNYFESSIESIRIFEKQAQEIESIVQIITSIALQTHILSINATIEAARAGEYGEGFAVVADEIRKLADESKSSAKKIASISSDINQNSSKVINTMENIAKQINKGKGGLKDINAKLSSIFSSVTNNALSIKEISSLSNKQLSEFKEVVDAVAQISKIAEDNAASTQEATASTQEQTASMQEMVESIQELHKLTEKLRGTISRFVIEDNG